MASRGVITFRIPSRRDLEDASRKAITEATQTAVAIVVARTKKGRDERGRPFVPYSDDYRLLKASTGRQVATVDLRLSGELLNRIKLLHVASPRLAYYGVNGVHRNARLRAVSSGQFISDLATRRSTTKHRLSKQKTTTPMAAIVRGLERTRPFLGIVTPEDRRRVMETYRRVLVREAARASGSRR
jgi:hypothetical protein